MSDEIYRMKLHDTVFIDSGAIRVTRVAGGWIYVFVRIDTMTSVYVPFSNEFQLERLEVNL